MSRTALILAAHGSRHDPAVNQRIHALADEIQSASEFDAAAAFHQGDPPFREVLDRLTCARTVVVPLMTSAGYYCNEVLPRELRKNRRYAPSALMITPQVGSHPALVDLISNRISAVAPHNGMNLSSTTVAVIGHGTPRNLQSRWATETLVERLRERALFGEVLEAFLDDAPGVESILARSSFASLFIVPFLIAAGPHVTQDIPDRLGAASADAGRSVFFDIPVGSYPELTTIILDLARSAVAQTATSLKRSSCLRLGTRSSALARWQAVHVAERLRAAGSTIEIVTMTASGDRDLSVPIPMLDSDSPFTDDLDAALLAGDIDLAVHSYKDLPLTLLEGLRVVAVLPRGDVRECLITKDGRTLPQLPSGSSVGTSSPRRRAQLLALRPDLRPVPLRGPVDDRIAQIRDRKIDAAILAFAGVQRLGRTEAVSEIFDLDRFLPAPGQGALAVVTRNHDTATNAMMRSLYDDATAFAVDAELAILRPFDGSRTHALSAAATADGAIDLRARLLSLDGTEVYNVHVNDPTPRAAAERALSMFLNAGALSLAGSAV